MRAARQFLSSWERQRNLLLSGTALLCLLFQHLAVAASETQVRDVVVEPCEGLKIAILDLQTFANSHNFPSCNFSNVVVNSGDGTVYLASERERLQKHAADHEFGSHAAPWYLREAIKSSKYYTEALEEADIVYVDDYCYYIWWLATVHTNGRSVKETPGDYLVAGYKALMEQPKWQDRQGQEFVFYESHPGFAAGDSARPYNQLKCFEMRKSTHLVMDTPMRYVCGGGWAYNKLFITPYNPNRLSLSNPSAHLEEPFYDLSARSLLTYHRSACAKLGSKVNNFNGGKMIRQYLARIFVQEARDVQVKCTNHDHTTALGGAKGIDFQRMFGHMQKTVFCLVLPGDAASTRRFSEIMMAGCIPTFVGPPYHSMPLIQDVDYRNAAVFFNVTDYSPWLEETMQTRLDPKQKSMHETEGRWWIPDGDISGRAIAIHKAEEIISRLRSFSVKEAAEKLALMRDFRHYFSFDTKLTDPPNAVNALLSGICRRGPLEPKIV